MAMRLDDVTARFALAAGLSIEEAAPWAPLCGDALAQIEAMARPEPSEAGVGILCGAAASLALYRWALQSACSCGESFSVGDLRVDAQKMNFSAARELWSEALAAAAPFLEDSGFVFGRAQA